MSVSFQITWFYLLGFAALLIGYTIFIYKTTVPEISVQKKTVLILLRISALVLLFLLIFEPLLKIVSEKTIRPTHYFFVDDSKSLQQFEKKSPLISTKLLTEIKKLPSGSVKLFSFGSNVSQIVNSDSAHFSFSEPVTNISKVFTFLQKEENIASVTLISDGIITQGTTPNYQAEKLNLPVFTIGIGDSSAKKDIAIQNILHNEFLYSGTSTPFVVSLSQHGFTNKKTTISLLEDNALLETKEISFSENELQNVEFTYKPKSAGEKKISFIVSPLPQEFSTANNKQSIFAEVLDSKLSVVLLAGSPSADVSFIKASLQADTNNAVQSFTQITSTQFLEKNLPEKSLDKADVFYLVNFPSQQTSDLLVDKVANLIKEKKIPYFFLLTSSVNPEKLRRLQSELPFNFTRTDKSVVEVQPIIDDKDLRNPLLQFSGKNILEQWNNLPPVYKPNWDISVKPESEILAKTKVNTIALNAPLIISKRLGSKRAVAVLASDIWKWKLQKAPAQLDLFDRFLSNGTKWLHSGGQNKQVKISVNKKFFSIGEIIYFSAEVYDEAFNAVNDAEIKCSAKNQGAEFPVSFTSIGNGFYEGQLTDLGKGDYSFSGEVVLRGKSLGKDTGRFSVGDFDYELQNTTMNSELLQLLAKETGGKFFYKSTGNLFETLNEISKNRSKNKITVNEYPLWSSEAALGFLILLFAAEWLIRKREGLL